uniref:Uncharacterized protein n=1 Tax=viral metagenome TaxID=1070528 RepID=A0A6C0E383_9ZZZZ
MYYRNKEDHQRIKNCLDSLYKSKEGALEIRKCRFVVDMEDDSDILKNTKATTKTVEDILSRYKLYEYQQPILQPLLVVSDDNVGIMSSLIAYITNYIKKLLYSMREIIINAHHPYKKDLNYSYSDIYEHFKNIYNKIDKIIINYNDFHLYCAYIEILYFCYEKMPHKCLKCMISEQIKRMYCPLEDRIFIPQIETNFTFYTKIFTTLYNDILENSPTSIKFTDYVSFMPTKLYDKYKTEFVRKLDDNITYNNDGTIKKQPINTLHGILNPTITKEKQITLEQYCETILKGEFVKHYENFKKQHKTPTLTKFVRDSIIDNLSNQTDLNEIKNTYIDIFDWHICEYRRIKDDVNIDYRWKLIYQNFILNNHNALYNIKLDNVVEITDEYLNLSNVDRETRYKYNANYMTISNKFIYGINSYIQEYFLTPTKKLIQLYLIHIFDIKIELKPENYSAINKILIAKDEYKLYYCIVYLFILCNYDIEITITQITTNLQQINETKKKLYRDILTKISIINIEEYKLLILQEEKLTIEQIIHHIKIIFYIDKFLNISTAKYLPKDKLYDVKPWCYGRTKIIKDKHHFMDFPFYRTAWEVRYLDEKLTFYDMINQSTNFCMGHNTDTLISGVLILNDNKKLPTQYYHIEKEYGLAQGFELIGILLINLIEDTFNVQYIILVLFDLSSTTDTILLLSHRGGEYKTGSITEKFSTTTKELYTITQIYGALTFQSKIMPNIIVFVPAPNNKLIESMLRKKNKQGKLLEPNQPSLYYDWITEMNEVKIWQNFPRNNLDLDMKYCITKQDESTEPYIPNPLITKICTQQIYV